MNVQTKINSTRETNNITQTTEMAKETTLLSPRFYTTDFDELDRVDVTPIRESWDDIMEELRSDPNKNHFKKNIEISAHFASQQALSKIEKAGGKLSLIKK